MRIDFYTGHAESLVWLGAVGSANQVDAKFVWDSKGKIDFVTKVADFLAGRADSLPYGTCTSTDCTFTYNKGVMQSFCSACFTPGYHRYENEGLEDR